MNPTNRESNRIRTAPEPADTATNQAGAPSISTRHLNAVLCGCLALLFCYSVYLSQTRIFQVDECQNLYMAKVLANGQSSQFFTSSSLFLSGPLSWITRTNLDSARMYAIARLLFLGVYWTNLVLMAWIASGRLFSTRSLIALVAAASLAPLWDYGFEIRHDNLVLTAVLAIWWLVRIKPSGLLTYFLTGIITVTLLFIAIKAVVYVLPLSGAILLFPPPGCKRPRWQAAAAWTCGALLALGAIRLSYGSSGGWDNYLSIFHGVSQYSAGDTSKNQRFMPWQTLARLLVQTPLVLALTFAAISVVVMDLLRRRTAAFSWDGLLPDVALLIGALGALGVNPTPFAYNLIHIVPYAFLLAFRYAARVAPQSLGGQFWPLTCAILVFIHAIPFGRATLRHLDYTNSRQTELMSLAEQLTEPRIDPVYDASGLVLTRSSIHYYWYLHSLNTWLLKTAGNSIPEMFAAKPPVVFIPSYRTDWLPEKDHAFIRTRYVPLADDFWVLGSRLPAGGGTFEVVHSGRYSVVTISRTGQNTNALASMISKRAPTGTLDKNPLDGTPVSLTVGPHQIETSEPETAIIWVGPSLDHIPPLADEDHRLLFRNWY